MASPTPHNQALAEILSNALMRSNRFSFEITGQSKADILLESLDVPEIQLLTLPFQVSNSPAHQIPYGIAYGNNNSINMTFREVESGSKNYGWYYIFSNMINKIVQNNHTINFYDDVISNSASITFWDIDNKTPSNQFIMTNVFVNNLKTSPPDMNQTDAYITAMVTLNFEYFDYKNR